jgi:hypothetical protein
VPTELLRDLKETAQIPGARSYPNPFIQTCRTGKAKLPFEEGAGKITMPFRSTCAEVQAKASVLWVAGKSQFGIAGI